MRHPLCLAAGQATAQARAGVRANWSAPEVSSPPLEKGEVELGIADLTHEPVVVNVMLDGFAVYRPPRSGRSSALASAAAQLAKVEADLWVVGSKGSPLQTLSCWSKQYFGRQQGLPDYVKELQVQCDSFPDRLRFLVVDDANEIDEMSLNKPLQALLSSNVVCLGSALDSRSLGGNALHKAIKAARNLLFLRGEDEQGIQAAAGKAPSHFVRPGLAFGQGTGLVIDNGRVRYAAIQHVRLGGRQ